MLRHTCLLFLAWFIATGVPAQDTAPAATSPRLETTPACAMEKIWDDKGSGADLDGYFYLPVAEQTYFIIGGYGTRMKDLTGADCVLTVKDSALLTPPADWELIWEDKGSGARQDGSIWRAVSPGDGYRCLGSVPQAGYDKPSLPNYRCVSAGLTEKVVTGTLLWTDKGSGAKQPVTVFKLPHTGAFVAVRGRLGFMEAYDLVTAPPETPPLAQEQAAATAAATTPQAAAPSPPPVTATPPAAVAPGTAAATPPETPPAAAAPQAEPAVTPGFPEQAAALRRAIVARDETAMRVLELLPGVSWLLPPDATEAQRDSVLKQTWGPFFENAVIETRAEDTSAPAALYYNPLLDVAVLTYWERTADSDYRITELRAAPGERLRVADTATLAAPAWMSSATPVETLYETTLARRAAFTDGVVPEPPGIDDERHARAVGDLRAAQPRLEWNALQRAEWQTRAFAWVHPTVAAIGETFAAGDAAALLAQAGDTDPETAAALVSLPAGLVERLTLDMTLDYGEDERLLVISLPDEGEIYIMAECRLPAGAGVCRHGRYVLVDLGAEDG